MLFQLRLKYCVSMLSLSLFAAFFCFCLCLLGSQLVEGRTTKQVIVWMCLDICGQGGENATKNLREISNHLDVVTAISFEKYTLGPNATLVTFDITEVAANVTAMGVESWPLLSSWPHPEEFMQWMRQAFAHPEVFTAQCVAEAKKYNYTGYNLDWEPTDEVTEQDGLDYATFVEAFAVGLHEHGLLLSVDVASWSPIWNYDALAQTSADSFISMGTYTSSDSSFTKELDKIMTSFGPRAGVGLQTVNASTELRLPMEEVMWRFDSLEASDAQVLALWKSPVPPLWWPLIHDFVALE